MKPLEEVELGSVTFGYYKHFIDNENITIEEFVRLEKKSKLKSNALNITYLTSLLFIILLPLTNFLITLLTVFLVYLISYFFTIYNFYDWYGLYESILKNGFNSNNENGYITVIRDKDRFLCQNGNHRLAMLNLIQEKSYKIKVWQIPSEPKKKY